MAAATRTSTTSRHRRRTHRKGISRVQRVPHDQSSNNTQSEYQTSTKKPGVDELRQVRAQFYDKTPEDRQRDAYKRMQSYSDYRRDLGLRKSSTKMSEVTVRELRRSSDLKHRPRRERPKDLDDDTVYVYRRRDDDAKENILKKIPRRRASTPRTSIKGDSERTHIREQNLSRRHTEKRRQSEESQKQSHFDLNVDRRLMLRPAHYRHGTFRVTWIRWLKC